MGNTGDMQLIGLLYACGLGFWLGLYYTFFRAIRLVFPPSAVGCFFQDVFFCVSATLVVFFVFLGIADGNGYPYLFAGIVAGFFAFHKTCGRFLHLVLAKSIRGILRLAKGIRDRMQAPIHAFQTYVQKFFRDFWHFLGKKCKKTLKNPKKIQKIT